LNLKSQDILGSDEVQDVMDSYMAIHMIGSNINELATISKVYIQILRGNITEMYPNFPETQAFVRDVQQSVAPEQVQFYFPEVTNLAEEIDSRYGRWQDNECRTMKDNLIEIEDSGPGGAGKVPLADFYHAGLNGREEFREHVDYLRSLGALDETDPQRPRILIPNYVHAPTNCVASSSYYNICCVNECEELMGHIDGNLAKPYALPSEILAVVEMMPSSTVSHNRTLPTWLLLRLDEVAAHHGGHVPIHGRLFTQWMHFAYPRECQYPHTEASQNKSESSWVDEIGRETSFNDTEMEAFINASRRNTSVEAYDLVALEALLNADADDVAVEAPSECAMWSMEEELVVRKPPNTVWSYLKSAVRSIMFVGSIAAALRGISWVPVRISDLRRSWALQDKYDF